jgi:predicted phosphodiesterase
MRYLILSDIHSNEEAFAAVLARVQRRKYDRVVILGDFVGYGADPNAVIERVTRMRKEKAMIRGNHDKVVCGLETGELFNPMALAAARWTADRLSPANRRFLEELPIGPLEVDGAFVICHGSPRDEDAYIFSDYDAT